MLFTIFGKIYTLRKYPYSSSTVNNGSVYARNSTCVPTMGTMCCMDKKTPSKAWFPIKMADV